MTTTKKNALSNEPVSVSLRDYIEQSAIMRQWQGATIEKYRKACRVILSLTGDIRVSELDAEKINSILILLIEKYALSTCKIYYGLLKNYTGFLYEKNIIDTDPFVHVVRLPSRKKRKEFIQGDITEYDECKIFTEEEIKKMFYSPDSTNNENSSREYYLNIFKLLFLTGMRGQEIRALTLNDIDFTNHTLSINKALSISTNKNDAIYMVLKEPKNATSRRVIGINKETEDVIKKIITLRPCRKNEYLVVDDSGRWLSVNSFEYAFKAVLREKGIPKNKRSPHSLRHTFVSFAIEKNDISPLKNKEMLFVSRYVGHKNLSMTLNIYTHITTNKLMDVDYIKA